MTFILVAFFWCSLIYVVQCISAKRIAECPDGPVGLIIYLCADFGFRWNQKEDLESAKETVEELQEQVYPAFDNENTDLDQDAQQSTLVVSAIKKPSPVQKLLKKMTAKQLSPSKIASYVMKKGDYILVPESHLKYKEYPDIAGKMTSVKGTFCLVEFPGTHTIKTFKKTTLIPAVMAKDGERVQMEPNQGDPKYFFTGKLKSFCSAYTSPDLRFH